MTTWCMSEHIHQECSNSCNTIDHRLSLSTVATHRYRLRHPLIILTCLYMSLSESVTLENSSLHGEPALMHGGSTQPLTHNDDEGDMYGTKSFKYKATYMPKAKSSSSNRIRAASIASTVKHNKKSGKARRNQNRRANKKNKKQCWTLIDVPMAGDDLCLSKECIDNNIVFGDGGSTQILLYYPSLNQSVIK